MNQLTESHKKIISVINSFEKTSIDKTIFQAISHLVDTEDPAAFALHLQGFFMRCIACSTSIEPENRNANKPFLLIVTSDPRIEQFIRWICPPALSELFATVKSQNLNDYSVIGEEMSNKFLIHFDLSKWPTSKLEGKYISVINDTSYTIGHNTPGMPRTIMPRIANLIGTSNNLSLLNKNAETSRLPIHIKGFRSEFWREGNLQVLDVANAWAFAKQLHDNGADGTFM